MDERAFYTEAPANKPATLNCPFCRSAETYELRWMVRKKKDRIPGGADERDRARFAKGAELYGPAGRQSGVQEPALPEAVRYLRRQDHGFSERIAKSKGKRTFGSRI